MVFEQHTTVKSHSKGSTFPLTYIFYSHMSTQESRRASDLILFEDASNLLLANGTGFFSTQDEITQK